MVWSFNFESFNLSLSFWGFLDEIWILRTLFLEEMISLHPLQNGFLSLTIKFSPGNCLTRSCNGTFVVLKFPLRLYFPLIDSKDRSRAIVEGTGLCSQSEFWYVAMHLQRLYCDTLLPIPKKGFIRAQIELSSTFVYDYKMSTGGSSRWEVRTSPMGGGGRRRGELQWCPCLLTDLNSVWLCLHVL